MLLVAVVTAGAVDMVAMEASVPAVEGPGQGGAFHLNVHPVTAGTWGHEVMEGQKPGRKSTFISQTIINVMYNLYIYK